MFFAYKKMLGRTEMRTRDRMYCQTIRTVRDISRDDRARIATCSLRTPTDRLKENYSIHVSSCHHTMLSMPHIYVTTFLLHTCFVIVTHHSNTSTLFHSFYKFRHATMLYHHRQTSSLRHSCYMFRHHQPIHPRTKLVTDVYTMLLYNHWVKV